MNLAIWNYPPAEFMVSGFTSGRVKAPIDIERHTIPECEELLATGQVDVAMIPTLSVLRDPSRFEVLPAVALSTWSYPYARLVLKHGLEKPVQRVVYNPVCEQEAFVTRLVLKEHYRMEPAFVPLEGASQQELLDAGEDATLVVGVDVPMWHSDALWMDIGQEWYELANYPMVWAFFATREGEASADLVRAVRENVHAAEQQRGLWVRAQETSATLHDFYSDDLRVRLDDLVLASLTEYRQYLYYYKVLDDMPEVIYAALPDDDARDEGGPEPLL